MQPFPCLVFVINNMWQSHVVRVVVISFKILCLYCLSSGLPLNRRLLTKHLYFYTLLYLFFCQKNMVTKNPRVGLAGYLLGWKELDRFPQPPPSCRHIRYEGICGPVYVTKNCFFFFNTERPSGLHYIHRRQWLKKANEQQQKKRISCILFLAVLCYLYVKVYCVNIFEVVFQLYYLALLSVGV